MTKRMLDHLVLPVADLSVARSRMTALGFTVAPTGTHPFGTANACVYFGDGTFLESLMVADVAAASAAKTCGNVFVARDARYRALAGDNGFSAVVLKSDDALADDASFKQSGISAGQVLDFERPAIDASGRADIAAFRLAFAADPNSPEPYFFTCQRVQVPNIDRSRLERHPNNAVAIRGVEARSVDPDSHATFLNDLLGVSPAVSPQGSTWALGNAEFTLTHEAGRDDDGMHLTMVRLAVGDLATIRALFNTDGIAYEVSGQSLIVPPAPGQGAYFSFEAVE